MIIVVHYVDRSLSAMVFFRKYSSNETATSDNLSVSDFVKSSNKAMKLSYSRVVNKKEKRRPTTRGDQGLVIA